MYLRPCPALGDAAAALPTGLLQGRLLLRRCSSDGQQADQLREQRGAIAGEGRPSAGRHRGCRHRRVRRRAAKVAETHLRPVCAGVGRWGGGEVGVAHWGGAGRGEGGATSSPCSPSHSVRPAPVRLLTSSALLPSRPPPARTGPTRTSVDGKQPPRTTPRMATATAISLPPREGGVPRCPRWARPPRACGRGIRRG